MTMREKTPEGLRDAVLNLNDQARRLTQEAADPRVR